jgi:hypothetical protein
MWMGGWPVSPRMYVESHSMALFSENESGQDMERMIVRKVDFAEF